MKTATIALMATLLGGCATTGEARPRAVETIRYDTTACFGFCPSYTVTVSSDGTGVFEGRGHTAVEGTRAFRVTPPQFAEFARRLKPVRAKGEVIVTPGSPLCGTAATDQITVDVRWTKPGTSPAHLAYYFGCRMGERDDIRPALRAAPQALPIAGFIGRPGMPR